MANQKSGQVAAGNKETDLSSHPNFPGVGEGAAEATAQEVPLRVMFQFRRMMSRIEIVGNTEVREVLKS